MNRPLAALLIGLTCPLYVGAENTRSSLERSRGNYRQAVARHGPTSPEARAAKQNLRTTRRQYHAQRRRPVRPEQQHSR